MNCLGKIKSKQVLHIKGPLIINNTTERRVIRGSSYRQFLIPLVIVMGCVMTAVCIYKVANYLTQIKV